MRNIFLLLAAVALLAAVSGCACCSHGSCQDAPEGCQGCPTGCHRGAGGGGPDAGLAAPATVAYPYYTTRGPRDFLDRNPQSIGP
jgi:hypothetical protein